MYLFVCVYETEREMLPMMLLMLSLLLLMPLFVLSPLLLLLPFVCVKGGERVIDRVCAHERDS